MAFRPIGSLSVKQQFGSIARSELCLSKRDFLAEVTFFVLFFRATTQMWQDPLDPQLEALQKQLRAKDLEFSAACEAHDRTKREFQVVKASLEESRYKVHEEAERNSKLESLLRKRTEVSSACKLFDHFTFPDCDSNRNALASLR